MDIKVISEIVIAVLGSSAIGAIVVAIFTNRRNKYDKAIENITFQRTGWREKIKEIAEQIQNNEYSTWNRKSLDGLLCQLEMNINSYGYLNRHVIDKDGHIWSEIEALRSADNVNEYNKRKRILLLELDFLLKEDWERSKKEVSGKVFNAWNILIVLVLIAVHGVLYFWICGQEHIFPFVFEGILIGLYSFLLPCEFFSMVFRKKRYGKEKNVRQLLRMRKGDKLGKVGDVVLGVGVIIIVYGLVFVLRLAGMMENITYNSQNEIIISEQGSNSYLEKTIYEMYENEMQELVLGEDVNNNNSQLSKLYLEVTARELFDLFWRWVFIYFFVTFMYAVYLIIKQLGDTQYKDSIRRVQLIENDFYVHELNELVQKVEQLGKRKNCAEEYEMVLRVLYIKLDELAKYLKGSKYSRMQTIESYSDVERELRYEAVYKDISKFLKLFGRKGRRLVYKKKAKKEVKKEFAPILKELDLNRLL